MCVSWIFESVDDVATCIRTFRLSAGVYMIVRSLRLFPVENSGSELEGRPGNDGLWSYLRWSWPLRAGRNPQAMVREWPPKRISTLGGGGTRVQRRACQRETRYLLWPRVFNQILIWDTPLSRPKKYEFTRIPTDVKLLEGRKLAHIS